MPAIRRYVPPDPAAGLDWSVAKQGNPWLISIADIHAELTSRTYVPMPSPFGRGVCLKGSSQIDEVVARFRNRLAALRIVPDRTLEPLDLVKLTSLTALKSLSLANAQRVTHASEIEKLRDLAKLEIEELPDEDVDLGKLSKLKWLHVAASGRWRNLSNLGHLQFLQMSSLRGPDLVPLQLPASIRRLEINGSSTFRSLRGIPAPEELRCLPLLNLSTLSTLESIAPLIELTHLSIEGCRSLVNIDAAATLPKLVYLEVRDCPKLGRVAPFPAGNALTHLFFTGSTRLSASITDIVARSPHLQFHFAAP